MTLDTEAAHCQRRISFRHLAPCSAPRLSVAAATLGVLLGAAAVEGQVTVPRDWRRLAQPPAADSQERTCSAHADALWVVDVRAGTLSATRDLNGAVRRDPLPRDVDLNGAIDVPPPAPPPPGGGVRTDSSAWARQYARDAAARRVVRVEDGWLIGFDGGEYGGSLWWYPTGSGPGRKLWPTNVQAIEQLGAPGHFIVLTGLDYVRPSGTVLRVNREGGAWTVRGQTALEGRAYASARHPAGLAIATARRLGVVEADGSVRYVGSLEAHSSWPRSMAVGPAGDIAIGWRFFVSLFTPRGGRYHEEWLVPAACRRFRLGDYSCTCTGSAP